MSTDEVDARGLENYILSIMRARHVLALVVVSVVASAAGAAEVRRGDVAISSDPPAIMCPAPPRTSVLSFDLKWKSWLYTGDAVAFDSIGNLYAAGGTTLDVFDSTLQAIRSVPLVEPASGLAVDGAGFAYVIGQSGRAYVYSPGGIGQRTFALPNLSAQTGVVSIDVTPDGCTLVYVGDGGSLNRFNACAQVALAPIASGERFDAVRALSDGGVAAATDGRIRFYDSNGRLLFDVAAPAGGPIAAFSFDTDGRSLWIANGTFLVRMGIVDRKITARTPVGHPGGVAVFGEHRTDASAILEAIAPKHRSVRH